MEKEDLQRSVSCELRFRQRRVGPLVMWRHANADLRSLAPLMGKCRPSAILMRCARMLGMG